MIRAYNLSEKDYVAPHKVIAKDVVAKNKIRMKVQMIENDSIHSMSDLNDSVQDIEPEDNNLTPLDNPKEIEIGAENLSVSNS